MIFKEIGNRENVEVICLYLHIQSHRKYYRNLCRELRACRTDALPEIIERNEIQIIDSVAQRKIWQRTYISMIDWLFCCTQYCRYFYDI